MTLTREQIKAITLGAVDVVEVDGYLRFLRFTEQETKTIDNPNLYYPAGVQLSFKTDGKALRLRGRTAERSGVRSYYAIDIWENGRQIGSVANLADADAVGNYAWGVYPVGDFSAELSLSEGEKHIRILLPHSVLAELAELTVEGASYVTGERRDRVLIAYGDSITQGYDALHPTNTYAVRVADALGATLYNKSLGGACFCPALAAAESGVTPDSILVAYGTNDWSCRDQETVRQTADGFFAALVKKHPRTPIYALMPIWRKDLGLATKFGAFTEIAPLLRQVCAAYPTVRVIEGFDLVPHEEHLFGDLYLHPSDAGFAAYAKNLLKEMEKT